MKYILDFDRTLFDVEKLYEQLARCNQSHLAGTPESLNHISVPELLFPDVADFLQGKKLEDLFIVSSTSGVSAQWERDYQIAKISASGLDTRVAEVRVLAGDKGVEAVNIAEQFSPREMVVFVDDRIEHCLSVKSALPDSHCFLLVRNKAVIGETDVVQGIPVVHSLNEVDNSILLL